MSGHFQRLAVPTKMNAGMLRLFWIAGGMVALALGIVGIALPILPTTPFIILAAFCFARGSTRLESWLVSHPRFGPALMDWRRHGAITRRAKRAAIVGMALALLISCLVGVSTTVLAIQALAMAGAATFVLTRPSPPA